MLDEARLYIREFRGALLLPGEQGRLMRRPLEVTESEFRPELSKAAGWCWLNDHGDIMASGEIAEQCLTRFFSLVERHAAGKLPNLRD